MRSTDTIFVSLLALVSGLTLGCQRDEEKTGDADTKTSAGAEAQPGQQAQQADQAVPNQQGGQATAGQLSPDARQFMLLAAQDGLLEVEAGRLAQTKATTDPVREYARMMVEHHSRANEELMRLAQTMGLELPKALDANGHEKLDKLREQTGRDFDEEYMDLMIDEHQRVIGMFERQAEREEDAAPLRGWASQTLPTLRSHLEQAKTAEDEIDEVPAVAPTDAAGAGTMPTESGAAGAGAGGAAGDTKTGGGTGTKTGGGTGTKTGDTKTGGGTGTKTGDTK